MAPTQATLSTEAPPLPIPSSARPAFAIAYQIRFHDIGKSAREIYGCATVADAVERLPFVAPQHDDTKITIEAEAAIVRFEDLADRDRAEYLAAMMSGHNGTQYFLKDGETVPTPAAVEEAPDETAEPDGYRPGSYAEYVARREARLSRKAEKRAEWAESREKKAEAAFKKEHAILNMIPLGQPILVGHHSERRHRRDLDRADNLMRKGIEHADMAKKHAYKSDACAAALERQYKPEFCDARIKEAEAGIRKCERELLYCKVRKSDQASADHWNLWLARYTEQRDFWTARLESVGGLLVATTAGIEKGDIIHTNHGPYEVLRVNKKTVTIKGWMRIPEMTFKFPVSAIQSVTKRAEA